MMRYHAIVLFFVWTISAIVDSSIYAREWMDVTGTHFVKADFIEFKDSKVVLKKEDGQTVAFPLEKLCRPDREHIASELLRGDRTLKLGRGLNDSKTLSISFEKNNQPRNELGALFLLGSMDQTSRKRFLERIKTVDKESLDQWVEALSPYSSVTREDLFDNIHKLDFLFTGNQFSEIQSKKYIDRLSRISLPIKQEGTLDALNNLQSRLGGDLGDHSSACAILVLIQFDEFFPMDKSDNSRMTEMLARLDSLDAASVGEFAKSIKISTVGSACHLATIDSLFLDGAFDRERFLRQLKLVFYGEIAENNSNESRIWNAGAHSLYARLMGVFSGIAILKSVEGNIVRVPGSRLSLADQEVLIDWLEFERQMPSVILTKVDHDILKAGLRQRELTKLGYRVWKSSKFSTQAHLSGFSNGIAYLKAPNGKILKVPYSDLSPDDQAFIDNWKKR